MVRRSLITTLIVCHGLVVLANALSVPPALSISEEKDCIPCELLFSKLTKTAEGNQEQVLMVQERGEPKSGTTFMFNWGRGALYRTCEFLKATYGESTCHITEPPIKPNDDSPNKVTMEFNPHLSGGEGGCSCSGVGLVQIELGSGGKHALPVAPDCPWRHNSGIQSGGPCGSWGGGRVHNASDLWSCMEEVECEITDANLQFVIFRDPRAAAVSTYFYLKDMFPRYQFHPAMKEEVDNGTLIILPIVCQWLVVRHILFEGLLSTNSTTFWYQEAWDDPLRWHHRWVTSVGLQLPPHVVENMAADAVAANFLFPVASAFNAHPGGKKAMVTRTWKDEVKPETALEMDSILRLWLPPVLLARFGVAP